MTAVQPEIGKEYAVDHSRKGEFKAVVKAINGEFATLTITQGMAHALLAHNERHPTEDVIVRLSLVRFFPLAQPEETARADDILDD